MSAPPEPRKAPAKKVPANKADETPTPERPKSLVAALAMIQRRMSVVVKGQTASVTSQRTGGTYTFDYADLSDVASAVYPLLGEVGLAFIAMPRFVEGGRYMLLAELAHESGDSREGEFLLPDRGTAQEIGSAISYGRRYLLGALTGITTGDQDDDGAAASSRRGRPSRPAQPGTVAQPPRQPDAPPSPGELRAEIARRGTAAGRTQDEIALDFQNWINEEGVTIRNANATELSRYLNREDAGA